MRSSRDLRRSTASRVPIPALASAALAIAMVALSSSTTVARVRSASAIEMIEGDMSLLPIVTMGRDSDMLVEFVILNCSTGSISYFPGYPEEGLEGLNTRLIHEDGTSVPYNWTDTGWVVDKKFIQTLPPSGTIEVKFSLRQQFGFEGKGGNFPNGRYELRAVRSPSSRGGSTPIKIDSPVMLLDVVDKLPAQNTGGMGLLLIAVTTFTIAEGMTLVYGFKFLRARRSHKRTRQE